MFIKHTLIYVQTISGRILKKHNSSCFWCLRDSDVKKNFTQCTPLYYLNFVPHARQPIPMSYMCIPVFALRDGICVSPFESGLAMRDALVEVDRTGGRFTLSL